MKKKLCLILTILYVMTSIGASASCKLPANLTIIGDESFMNDTAIKGLVEIPAGVSEIGQNAFSGTNLFALDIPATVQTMKPQALNNAVYVWIRGNSQVESLSGTRYIIAPEGSNAASWAQLNEIPFVPDSEVLVQDGFLYQKTEDQLILLSAKDGTALPSSVKIPAEIDGTPLTGIGEFAFAGCTGLKTIDIPESLQGLSDVIAEQCPEATVTQYEVFRIKSISMNRKPGSTSETVTWTVTTTDDNQSNKYSYTLKRNGQTIDTVKSSSKKTYTASISMAGEYQLEVSVKSPGGIIANGSSQTYVAVETMKMECPSTLQNGENLQIDIQSVPGAIQYSIIITEETSGKSISTRTLTKPGTVTIDGYLLNTGKYRISGYVYGNDFRYTIPTVRYVQVSGTKSAAPDVELTSTEVYTDWCEAYFTVQNGQYEEIAYHVICGSEDYIYTSSNENPIRVGFGQSGTVAFSIRKNGKWTAWSSPSSVIVPEAEQLAVPEVIMETEWREGEDIWLTVGDVPHADEMNFNIFPGDLTAGDYDYYPDSLFNQCVRKGGTYALEGSGIVLPAGEYTLATSVWAETGYRSNETKTVFTVTENNLRPGKPAVSATRTEVGAGSWFSLTITLDGADAVYPKVTSTKPNGRTMNWDNCIQSANSAKYLWEDKWDEDYLGYVFHYSFAVRKDGIWSNFSDPIDITVTEHEYLPETMIHVPEDPKAGQNLTISYDAVENATEYRVSLWRAGSEIEYDYYSNPEEVTFDGKQINRGTYQIQVEARDDTGDYSSSTAIATVEVTGERPVAPIVTADKYTISAGENPTFTIETDGVDSLHIQMDRFYIYAYSDNYHIATMNVYDSTTIWSDDIYVDSGTDYLLFHFYSFIDGIWSEPAEVRINVEAAEDRVLDAPVWTMESEFEAGQDIEISFESVENAEYYDVYVYNAAGVRIKNWYDTEDHLLTLDGYNLTAGTYSVIVDAYAKGYQSSSSKTTFSVSGTREAAPNVQSESETVCAGRYARFTIDTSEAQKAVVRYYTLGNSYSEYDIIDINGAETNWNYYIGEGTTPDTRFGFSFSVMRDGKWTLWSPTQIITIADQEQLVEPAISFGTAEAGKDLTITIGESANATSYEVRIYQNGQYINWYSFYQPGNITIPGYRIDGGSQYIVQVTVSDSTGEYASATAENSITATGTRGEAPTAQVSSLKVNTNEYFTFTIDTTGATMVAMNYGSSSMNNYSTIETFADETPWRTYQYSAGEYQYRFSLLKDGVWTAWSNPIMVTVTAAQSESLETPTFEIESGTIAGEDLVVNISPVPNASEYDISLRNRYGNEVYSGYNTTGGRFTIPGYMLSTGEYTIRIQAYGTGHYSSISQQTVTVSGNRESAPKATTGTTEITWGKYMQFTVDTTDAEAAAVRYYTLGSSGSTVNSFEVTGSETVWQKRVYNDAEIGTRYGFMFSVKKDGRWTAWSSAQIVTVVSKEYLAAPDITFGDATAGKDLKIYIGESANATYYEVRIYQENQSSWWYGFPQARNISIPGYRVDGGSTFRVQVTVSDGTGEYAGATSEGTITVDGGRSGVLEVQASASNVMIEEQYSFTINTTGAEMLAINYGTSLSNYTAFEVFDPETQWSTYSYSAGVYQYRFALRKNNVWTAWSEPVTVTVNAGTALQKPVIHLDSGCEAGEDLLISVDEVPNATSYYLYLYNAYQNEVYSSSVNTETRTLTIPGYRLAAGDYTVDVSAYGPVGFVSSSSSESFQINGQRPDAPQAELTSTEPSNSWSSQWIVSFALSAEDAEKLVCRKWIQGSTQMNYQTFSEGDLSSITISQWVEDRKIYCYSFSVYKNGKWSAWSTAVRTTLPSESP